MPAGDQIVADYQVEIQGLLTGATTVYYIGFDGISGLGTPKAKTQDVDLAGQHGAYAGPDYLTVRILLIPYEVISVDAEAAGNAHAALVAAWQPSLTNVELHLQLPGLGHGFFIGRPRGLDTDLRYFHQGAFSAIAEFWAVNPVAQPI